MLIALALLCPLFAHARAVRTYDTRALVTQSELVFVGRVLSIQPSGVKTTMSYPTWRDVIFEWLKVEVEVVEPIKGGRKGERVSTAMLTDYGGTMINAPGMIEPKKGEAYLLCLLPTTISNVFAALSAPWDEDQSVFILDREESEYRWYFSGDTNAQHEVWRDERERAVLLWSLVDDRGRILTNGGEQMRQTFRKEIKTPPATNAVIHLQWETWKAPSGWQWDVPTGYGDVTNSTGSTKTQNKPVEVIRR